MLAPISLDLFAVFLTVCLSIPRLIFSGGAAPMPIRRTKRNATRARPIARRALTAIAPGLALLLAAGPLTIRTGYAQSGCGTYVIQGTQVQECYSAQNNYVTFSNSCGSQSLTQSQMQAGAIPNQIVPCPRPGSGSSSNGNGGSSSATLYAQEAAKHFGEATAYASGGDYLRATTRFEMAADEYRKAGDRANTEIADRNRRLASCRMQMQGSENAANTLRFLRDPQASRGLWDDKDVGVCQGFPEIMDWLNKRIAALDAAEKQHQEEVAQQKAGAELKKRVQQTDQFKANDPYAQAGGLFNKTGIDQQGARAADAAAQQFATNNPYKSNAFAATAPAKATPVAPTVVSPSQNPTPPSQDSGAQSASCSTLTGGSLGDSSPAAGSCSTGNTALAQAQKLSQQNPAAARAKYQEAADAYRRAGDIATANAMLAAAQALVAALPSNPPSRPTAASQAGTTAPGDVPPAPANLVRDVGCDEVFPGETGMGLYLKGRYRTACTVERSYHDRSDATNRITIRVTACARSESEMEVPSLARMRARDYAFSLALRALPGPEMDAGGDVDVGCGK